MKRNPSNRAIKGFLSVLASIFISNLIASLIGIPNEKRLLSIHSLQYDVLWIIVYTVVFFALGLHKKD